MLWGLDGDPKLSPKAIAAISADPTMMQVSAVTAWEIATKARIGKLPDALDVAADERPGALPGPLRHPFDRMLIAQAMLENLRLVSIERAFDAYGVLRLW